MDHCAICGQDFVPKKIGTGYAVRCDQVRVCYSCAGDDLRREIEHADPKERIIGCYLAHVKADPSRGVLTDWPGNVLGSVHVTERRVGFGGKRLYFSGVVCGRRVHGNAGGYGMYAHVRVAARL